MKKVGGATFTLINKSSKILKNMNAFHVLIIAFEDFLHAFS